MTTDNMMKKAEDYDSKGEEWDNNKNLPHLAHTNIHDTIGTGLWHW